MRFSRFWPGLVGLGLIQLLVTPGAEAAKAEVKPAVVKKVAKAPIAAKKTPVAAARASKASKSKLAAAKPAKKVTKKRVSAGAASAAAAVAAHPGMPALASSSVLVINQTTGEVLLEKNAEAVVPIASITKLMTAMVVLDAQLSLTEDLVVSDADVDTLKGSSSRLPVGTHLDREEMLRLALMASENRAASALSRHYPGGRAAFVAAMNRKAEAIGLTDTRFHDSTGLSSTNVSSARDLTKMVAAASRYPLIREYSTTQEREVTVAGRTRRFGNTNALVKNPEWDIGVSKTGYISESGRCLVMQAWLDDKPLIIVLLDSLGKYTRVADAQRIRKWFEATGAQRIAATSAAHAG